MTRASRLVIAILAVTVAACSSSLPATPPAATPPTSGIDVPATVSVAEAATLRNAGAFVLDVREPDEWAAGHIPGATLIPLGELSARLVEVPADRTTVVICRSGNRSAQGRDILRAAGYAAVTSVSGGMTDWVAAGLPVE